MFQISSDSDIISAFELHNTISDDMVVVIVFHLILLILTVDIHAKIMGDAEILNHDQSASLEVCLICFFKV